MAVINPLKITFENWPEDKVDEIEVEYHPDHPEMGSRMLHFTKVAYIEKEDFMEEPVKKFFRLAPGKEVRLKGAYIVKCESFVKDENGEIVEVICSVDMDSRSGSEGANRKVKGTLHWLSEMDAKECEFRLYEPILLDEDDASDPETEENDVEETSSSDFMDRVNPNSISVVKGFCEPAAAETETGTVYQFLRMGYFCKDPDSAAGAPVYNRTVPLKDSWAKTQK
jgi:glutaminyl-tRNA synthetase